MKKIVLLISMMILVVGILSSCSNETEKTDSATTDVYPTETAIAEDALSTVELTLTFEELAKYNGKDGNPAYVAVDGVIYDVTDVKQWKNGEHNGNSAGIDATEIIKNLSPHGLKVLEKLEVVGKIVD